MQILQVSVFCSHGAGFVVPWDQVEQYMHVKTDSKNGEMYDIENVPVIRSASNTYRDSYATDKELEEIFEKTFGPIKRKKYTEKKVRQYSENKQKATHKKSYLSVF